MGKPQREVEPFQDDLRMLRKNLGNRIRELRAARGWSQEEFAANAHVHRTFAGSLERGEKNCSFHALVLIARCFGITISDLMKGIETGEALNVKRFRSGLGALDQEKVRSELAILERVVDSLRKLTSGRSRTDRARS